MEAAVPHYIINIGLALLRTRVSKEIGPIRTSFVYFHYFSKSGWQIVVAFLWLFGKFRRYWASFNYNIWSHWLHYGRSLNAHSIHEMCKTHLKGGSNFISSSRRSSRQVQRTFAEIFQLAIFSTRQPRNIFLKFFEQVVLNLINFCFWNNGSRGPLQKLFVLCPM